MADARGRRALICLLPGLGDALMASPIMNALVGAGFRCDALTMLRPVTEYASALEIFEQVNEVPFLHEVRKAFSLFGLRSRRYDLVIVPVPAARWQYAAVAWLTGGKRTFVHRYGGFSSIIARLGSMHEVALRGGHRVAENVRLAEAAGLQGEGTRYLVPPSWRSHRKQPNLLGMHTGSMSYKGNEQKRWPLERFVQIAQRHLSKGLPARAFVGPNEEIDAENLRQLVPALEVVQAPLAAAARKISECEVFLANDSGLAHLASGLGVATLVLFGMTDPTRCKPVGCVEVLRPSTCPPCFDEGMRHFTCVRNIGYRCLNQDLHVDFVERELDRAFEGGLADGSIDREGSVVLYGRAYV